MTAKPDEAVRAALQAYVDSDRDAIEALIADEYVFTSPMDNRLNRKRYFEICWPNHQTMTRCEVIYAAVDGEFAYLVYEAGNEQKLFRNFELHRVRNGQIVQTEVYFGWDVPHPVPLGEHDTAGGKQK